MSKINLEAFKLSKVQMNKVNGGQEDTFQHVCDAVEYQAAYYAKHGATDKEWEQWIKDFYEFCV